MPLDPEEQSGSGFGAGDPPCDEYATIPSPGGPPIEPAPGDHRTTPADFRTVSPRADDHRTLLPAAEDYRTEPPRSEYRTPHPESSGSVPSEEESLGGWLPSRPRSLAQPPRQPPVDPASLGPGGRIGDFVVERVLGRGGFGVVYLARQISLERHVALKVVTRQGGASAEDGEGRSLARLEHENIVQVYAEMMEPASGARLLCMQYVAGTTLATLIGELKKFGSAGWTGADLLRVLDGLDLPPALFDPQAMRDRDFLASADHVEAVCRIGEQLARALAHAHDRGVLHRDVKPANVLVSRYGRPLLADFNLATRDAGRDEGAVFGGTLPYMAPEHLEAFHDEAPEAVAAVDHRSDMFSLCVVLWELSTGGRPFPTPSGAVDRGDRSTVLCKLASQRRVLPPERPPVDRRLKQVLLRGLAGDPDERYGTAEHLAETVAGLREQRAAVRAFPPADLVARWAWRHAVLALLLAGLLPQFVGSVLQISYNEIRILPHLTPRQQGLFWNVLVPAYNLIAYPGCLTWLGMRLVRVVRVWNALRRGGAVTDEAVDTARVRALRLPLDTAIVGCVGWLPGAVLFPAALHFGADPVPPSVWGHFAVSFCLAGLIAVTYSFFLGTGVVVRTMYVRFWSDPRDFRERAAQELAPVPDRLRGMNVAAGIIPLIGAMMLLMTMLLMTGAPGEDKAFAILAMLLILAGVAGFAVMSRLSRRYHQVVDACSGNVPAPQRRTKRATPVSERGPGESSFGPGGSQDLRTR